MAEPHSRGPRQQAQPNVEDGPFLCPQGSREPAPLTAELSSKCALNVFMLKEINLLVKNQEYIDVSFLVLTNAPW